MSYVTTNDLPYNHMNTDGTHSSVRIIELCKTYKFGVKLFRERLSEPKRKGACENPKTYSGIAPMNFEKYFKPAISYLS